MLLIVDLKDMDNSYSLKEKMIQLNGKGLLSKGEVTVSISKAGVGSGIAFILNNQKISCEINNVSNANRNTVLSNGIETVCLVEHFLAACSMLGINDIEVTTNKNELIFNDGSAIHWYEALKDSTFRSNVCLKYKLKETIFIKNNEKVVAAIPHDGFKVSYFMDYNHPALGKLFASWDEGDEVYKLVLARTFATKEENDFFGASDWLLTLEKDGFNKKLHEPLEPANHKILDIIGDLRLTGINPLEVNMHVIGIKSGHALNVEMAKVLKQALKFL